MDYYYRKLMGNGAVTSKFRLMGNTELSKEQNDGKLTEEGGSDSSSKLTIRNGYIEKIEHPDTHHSNNCSRCYRLKKKCSRLYPKCSNCEKMGAECEYLARTDKRRKRKLPSVPGECTMKVSEHEKETEVYEVKEKGALMLEIGADGNVSAHRLMTISSLLSNEKADEKQDKDGNKRVIPKRKIIRRESSGVDLPVVEKLRLKKFKSGTKTNLKDEFVTMKPIKDANLSIKFVENYFHNFEYKYPFIDKLKFLKVFEELKFTNETIVYLDVYLLMSIGCLIYDSNFKTNYFDEYFNHRTISSIVDILTLNIDPELEDDLENIKLLLLLSIYSLYKTERDLHWELVATLSRFVSWYGFYRPSSSTENSTKKERIFWSIYNLDKEFSLLQDIPSQIPSDSYIGYSASITVPLYEGEDINLINQQIKLSKLKNTLLDLKLKAQVGNIEGTSLSNFSGELEKWRISASSTVHNSLANNPYLQDFISVINLEYYYLSIELDQISSSESLQFTLQFLSNSYSLFMIENSKNNVEISLNSILWYASFFKVIRNNLLSLIEILKLDNPKKSTSILKISELNGNLQLVINLLRYVYQIPNLSLELQEKIKTGVEVLTSLNLKLIRLDICAGSEDQRKELIKETEHIKQSLQ